MYNYQLVLFLHLCALFAAFAASTLVHFSETRMCAASSVADLRGWAVLVTKTVKMFPIAILVLVGSGAYLVHAAWSWHVGWVDTGLLGIGLLIVNGPILGGSRLRRIMRCLATASDGPVTPELATLVRDPLLHAASWGNTLLALGIALVMVMKFPLADSIGILVAALLMGLAIAMSSRHGHGTSGAIASR